MDSARTEIIVSDEEADELYRFTLNDYINPNKWPALLRLLDRVSARVRDTKVSSGARAGQQAGAALGAEKNGPFGFI